MKKVLIVSPHFPPVNSPDMQRVRMSLPYYKELGWEPVVLCVDEQFVTGFKDELLSETIPSDIRICRVKALPAHVTARFGVGSLSIRSYYHFKKAGNKLLAAEKFDLVFFSTTLFHVCALGPYWKKKFGVPFIVDMQDPWRNDFYLSKPRSQRPPKFWASHRLDKTLEAYTMPHAAGIISVSQAYINNLTERYQQLRSKPTLLLPFGVSAKDFELVQHKNIPPQVLNGKKKISVVYMGAINSFFLPMIRAFFTAFKNCISNPNDYHFYFIGTNYALHANHQTVKLIGNELGVGHLITEVPQRIPYFSALATLMHADVLFVPGSADSDYNASKIYNNIFSGKPIFSIFHEKSLVRQAIEETSAGIVVCIQDTDTAESLSKRIEQAMPDFSVLHLRKPALKKERLQKFMANTMAKQQVNFFNEVVENEPV
ncbi:MAG TPA: glycosyltransferase [Flavisolibacter sp.]|nr:glycosyltransferase [Flavisolibacter sp.]